MIHGWGIPCEITYRWMSLAHTDKLKSVKGLVCHISLLPYGVTWPKHSNTSPTKSPNSPNWCWVQNEDVVGAGDAPSTSEWSTIILPTKVRFILEVWQYSPQNLSHMSTSHTNKFPFTWWWVNKLWKADISPHDLHPHLETPRTWELKMADSNVNMVWGYIFCLLLGVSSGCAGPITGQVTSVTWPVIGWA